MNTNKFFIVGCPRSGTTVLQQALNRHSQVVVPAESKYFYYFYGMSLRWQQRHAARMMDDLGIDLPVLEKAVRSNESHREFFSDIARQCVDKAKDSLNAAEPIWFGDKTPEHTLRIGDLRQVYPQCPIIFIYRDPRDVVVSLRNVPWVRCGVRSAARIWTRFAKVHQQLRVETASGRETNVFFISYESLVANPESSLTSICDFLGLTYEAGMASGSGDKCVIPLRELAWKSRSLEPINSSRTGRWRHELSDAEVAQVERITGEQMVQMEYSPETDPPYRLKLRDWIPMTTDMIRMVWSLTYQCLMSELGSTIRHVFRRADQAHIHPCSKDVESIAEDKVDQRLDRAASSIPVPCATEDIGAASELT